MSLSSSAEELKNTPLRSSPMNATTVVCPAEFVLKLRSPEAIDQSRCALVVLYLRRNGSVELTVVPLPATPCQRRSHETVDGRDAPGTPTPPPNSAFA